MNQNIISAVFDDRSEAEAAVNELRSAGVETDNLSIIGRDEEQTSVRDGTGEVVEGDATGDAVKGALGGAGIGALLGVAALAIPGVGPLVAAGAIASSAIPSAAAIGAGAGALAGGLTGLLRIMVSATTMPDTMRAASMTVASSFQSMRAVVIFRRRVCARYSLVTAVTAHPSRVWPRRTKQVGGSAIFTRAPPTFLQCAKTCAVQQTACGFGRHACSPPI